MKTQTVCIEKCEEDTGLVLRTPTPILGLQVRESEKNETHLTREFCFSAVSSIKMHETGADSRSGRLQL
jgi:hypothetical protein